MGVPLVRRNQRKEKTGGRSKAMPRLPKSHNERKKGNRRVAAKEKHSI